MKRRQDIITEYCTNWCTKLQKSASNAQQMIAYEEIQRILSDIPKHVRTYELGKKPTTEKEAYLLNVVFSKIPDWLLDYNTYVLLINCFGIENIPDDFLQKHAYYSEFQYAVQDSNNSEEAKATFLWLYQT